MDEVKPTALWAFISIVLHYWLPSYHVAGISYDGSSQPSTTGVSHRRHTDPTGASWAWTACPCHTANCHPPTDHDELQSSLKAESRLHCQKCYLAAILACNWAQKWQMSPVVCQFWKGRLQLVSRDLTALWDLSMVLDVAVTPTGFTVQVELKMLSFKKQLYHSLWPLHNALLTPMRYQWTCHMHSF